MIEYNEQKEVASKVRLDWCSVANRHLPGLSGDTGVEVQSFLYSDLVRDEGEYSGNLRCTVGLTWARKQQHTEVELRSGK